MPPDSPMPHLLVAISSHGFGHLAQVAPVVNRLHEMLPQLQLTLRTALPETRLRQHVNMDFSLQAVADDFGMQQLGALRVDLQASLNCYHQLHSSWETEVDRVAQELATACPDLLFADVPYLTLAAAQRAGIPSVAMCSLNWQAILQGYLQTQHDEADILRQMLQAYAAAELFLRPEPSMPMPGLENLHDIGVVCNRGKVRRAELMAAGLLRPDESLVLVLMGGVDHRLPVERWPRLDGVRYAVPAAWHIERQDCLAIEACGMGINDLMASSDLVITKPGYGTFTEAAANALPVLYVRRGDWPEEPCLVDWLGKKGNCYEISLRELEQGRVEEPLRKLLSQPRAEPVALQGVSDAASILFNRLHDRA